LNKLTRLFIACVCVAGASAASAACESGSVHEQLTCLQREICPNPSSEAERIACYRMITTALSGKEIPDVANESIEPATAESTAESTAEWVSTVESVAESATESTPEPRTESTIESTAESPATVNAVQRPALVPEDEPVVRKVVLSEPSATDADSRSRFSLTKLFRKKADDDPDWTEVVYIRTELRGTELIVLDNGQIWAENERNPYRQFRKHDRVRVSESGQLVRQDGSRTRMFRVDCDSAKPLKGRCKTLGKYLD